MVIVDIEASGLDPKKSSILSIGAVDFSNPERTYYAECKAWEGALLDKDSLAVCGFSEEQCLDVSKHSISEMMHSFKSWLEPIEERTLVGQNVSFDRDYLNTSFGRSGISWNFSFRTIDIHTIAYIDHLHRGIPVPLKNQRTALNLETIAIYVGIPEEPKPHNALTGAQVEAEALSRMLYGKQLLPEFKDYGVPKIFSPSNK